MGALPTPVRKTCRLSAFRLLLLLLLLGLALGLWLPRPLVAWLPWPIQCNGAQPAWLPKLVQEAKSLGFPGFQLSLVEAGGQRVDCAVGWARFWPWPEPLRTEHVMRYASLSKLMTSARVLQLFELGVLHPDSLLVDALGMSTPPLDPRVKQITVADLLRHKAGFDRAIAPDPMMEMKPWCPADINRLAAVRLDHDPGTVYAYSNLGYCLLGVLLERYERLPLETAFQRNLLLPLHLQMTVAHQGKISLEEPQAVFAENESLADLMRMNFDAMHATGAWAGTSSTFLTFLNELAGPSATLIGKETRHTLLQAAPTCDDSNWRHCHGYGFYRYKQKGRASMFWRDGSLPGVTSFAAVLDNGASVVFLAHARHYDWKPINDRLGQIFYEHLAVTLPSDK